MRTLSPDFINKVLNHPKVHKWLGVEEGQKVDVTSVVTNPDNVTLVDKYGGFICVQQSPGVYEVHTQFVPEGWGSVAPFMEKCLWYMFIRTNCKELLTQVPDNNPHAASLAQRAGFKLWFHRDDTSRGPTSFMRLTLEDWIENNAELCEEGDRFHSLLHNVKRKSASELVDHLDDLTHNCAVGATAAMIKAGNIFKGVDFYNKWASFAGYAPITVLNDAPPVIDIVDAVVSWDGENMEILLCR